jgi:LacI family transcriptional regulator
MLRRTGTVGAVFPTVDNAIFSKAIESLQRRLAGCGMQLLIATSGYDREAESREALNLVTHGADAIAFCGRGQDAALLQLLRQRGVPWVHVMSQPDGDVAAGGAGVGFDNAAAIGQAVRYLLDLGHRRFAMLAGVTRDNDRASARVEGVRSALAVAGIALAPSALVERPYGLVEGRDGLRSLLAAEPRPTAVLCGNDVLALGALFEAQRLGIPVPQALSIVGFDDLEITRHVSPPLTTIHVPTERMWSLAADRLVAALRSEPAIEATTLEVELVVRGSTGPAPRD